MQSVEAQERALFDHTLRVIKAGLAQHSPAALRSAQRMQADLLAEAKGLNDQLEGMRQRKLYQAVMHMLFPSQGYRHPEREAMIEAAIKRCTGYAAEIQEHINRYGAKGLPADRRIPPTPERVAKPRQLSTIDRLTISGHISAQEQAAAESIARVFEAASKSVFAKTGKLEAGVGTGAWSEKDMPHRLERLRSKVYVPWTTEMHAVDPTIVDLCINVCVYSHSIKQCAAARRERWDKTQGTLVMALKRYDRRLRRFRMGVIPKARRPE